jgi:oligopeptide/dipeptide ABC transporter ATP-binding protein
MLVISRGWKNAMIAEKGNSEDVLVQISDVKTWFPIKKGFLRRVVGQVKAVDGVSLSIRRGETVGLVGESGCGKTTLGRTILRLIPATSGGVEYRVDGEMANLFELDPTEMFSIRRRMQIIFQDPNSSLNPRMSVGDIVGEYIKIHRIPDRRERIVSLLESVGLSSGYLHRYPHAFSGGQRQRIAIARALSLDPEFVVCDEPVSALDVSVQAQIINLLRTLQRERHLTYLFISHDLSIVQHLSDRMGVMYLGQVVEFGEVHSLFRRPLHPYTEGLLSAIPSYHASGRGRSRSRIVLEGDVPSPVNPPTGCRFHTRCRYVEDVCRQETPPLVPTDGSSKHYVACHLADKLTLKGVGEN